jgi:hypothetical protein
MGAFRVNSSPSSGQSWTEREIELAWSVPKAKKMKITVACERRSERYQLHGAGLEEVEEGEADEGRSFLRS